MNTHRAALAAFVLACTGAIAQTPPPATVGVDLTRLSGALAQRLQLEESQMPMSIQVPPQVAAEVCGPEAVRAPGCVARQSSPELDRLLATRMRADDPKTMGAPPAPPRQ